jgi:hypothetical protein
MGEDHSQAIIGFLREWRVISEQELDAISKGNLDELEELINRTVLIQECLDRFLQEIDAKVLSKEAIGLMKEIDRIQVALVQEMQKGTSTLEEKINALKKNTASMRGYKQRAPVQPRFLNKRT